MPNKMRNIVVLDNIRSVLNVGSIFRTADAAGIKEIWLVGVTPTPIDRFGRARADFSKTALGAENFLKWKHFEMAGEVVDELKKQKYKIISLEQAPRSVDYKKVKPISKTAFVFGSETEGVSPEFLKNSNQIAEIKMSGKKESLNVAVSAGIFLFRVLGI